MTRSDCDCQSLSDTKGRLFHRIDCRKAREKAIHGLLYVFPWPRQTSLIQDSSEVGTWKR